MGAATTASIAPSVSATSASAVAPAIALVSAASTHMAMWEPCCSSAPTGMNTTASFASFSR